jgi:hypothetical protein
MHGKWSKSGIPHKGWGCVSVEDLDTSDAVCEMCEHQEIRYVHHMQHPDYPDVLGVGCVCADFVARLLESITKFLDRPLRWEPQIPSDAEADEALSRVQREVFARLHEFVEGKILHVPRQQWMQAFEHKGRGSTYDRAKVIQTIYEASAPIPGPALDPNSEQFLRAIRLLVHDAIRDGGGELVSDVLGQSADADVPRRSAVG